MSFKISDETETRLAAEAERRGISVDTLLQQFLAGRAALMRPPQQRPELPLWHLGSAGAYHRRDIYDDAG
jgi:hypothetical protein